jgi:hypothetical protein
MLEDPQYTGYRTPTFDDTDNPDLPNGKYLICRTVGHAILAIVTTSLLFPLPQDRHECHELYDTMIYFCVVVWADMVLGVFILRTCRPVKKLGYAMDVAVLLGYYSLVIARVHLWHQDRCTDFADTANGRYYQFLFWSTMAVLFGWGGWTVVRNRTRKPQ